MVLPRKQRGKDAVAEKKRRESNRDGQSSRNDQGTSIEKIQSAYRKSNNKMNIKQSNQSVIEESEKTTFGSSSRVFLETERRQNEEIGESIDKINKIYGIK